MHTVNVFEGILDNPLFYCIMLATSVLQVLIVEFGSIAFKVHTDGLSGKNWALSIGLGALALPVQQIINLLYRCGQHYNGYRIKKRLAKNGHLSTQPIVPSTRPTVADKAHRD